MATLIPTGMNEATGQFHIGKGTDLIKTPALIGLSNTPTLTMGSSTIVGTGASASIIGTNLSGYITLTTGTGVLSVGKVMTLTFANSFAFPNGCVVTFSPGNSNFAGILTKLYAATSVTGADLFVGLTALTISTTYVGYYSISGW